MPLTDGMRRRLGLDRSGQGDHVVGDRLAEALGLPRARVRVRAHIAGGTLHEDALRAQLGFDLVLEKSRVVGRVLEELSLVMTGCAAKLTRTAIGLPSRSSKRTPPASDR